MLEELHGCLTILCKSSILIQLLAGKAIQARTLQLFPNICVHFGFCHRTMAFNRASHVDVRGSNFSNVGRDHNIYQTINITIADQAISPVKYTPSRTKRLRDDDISSQVQYKRRKLSQNLNLVTDRKLPDGLRLLNSSGETLSTGTGSAGAVAASLIVKIVHLLIDRKETGDDYRMLELELEPLRQILTLTDLAIQTYDHTPLGQNLASCIIPEIEQIGGILQELFDSIHSYRQDGLPSLREKLSASQTSLGVFLMALNS